MSRHRRPLPSSPSSPSSSISSKSTWGRRAATPALGAAALALLVAGFIGAASAPATAADATVDLGTATSYAVLAGSAVSNTGPSIISGNLGLSPGSAVSGFPPGLVINGTKQVGTAVATKAQNDLTTAYNDAAGRPTSMDVTDKDLGGMTLTPGVYEASTAMALTGTVTLNAVGDPNAVFIFKAGTTLVAASNSKVKLINGASPCNVFWKVGSSATLHTSTRFIGTILALTSATLETTATLEGRVLARNGAVTLDTNLITAPGCGTTPPGSGGTGTGGTGTGGTGTGTGSTGGPSPAADSPAAGTSSGISAGTNAGTHGGTHGGTAASGAGASTQGIPAGHPSTGVGVALASAHPRGDGSPLYLVLAGLAGAAALVSALVRSATTRRR